MLDARPEQVREQTPESPSTGIQRRRRKGRPRRANPRFTEAEWRDVQRAARLAGLTPSGWTAATGVAVARQNPPPRIVIAESKLRELAETRKQLVRVGTLLNQSVRAVNASGEVAPGLPYLAGRVEVLLSEVDRLTASLMTRSTARS